MAKKDPGEMMSEVGNWNSSANYAYEEINNPLKASTKYMDVALHGYVNFEESLYYIDLPKDVLRYEGLKRFVNELLKVITNSYAFFKVKGTKNTVDKCEKDLLKIREMLKYPIVFKMKTDIHGNKTIVLNENFERVVDCVIQLKKKLLTPLNKNDLVFFNKEEFDPKEYKRRVIEDAISMG